jgi:hypothetical protein
LLKTFLFQDATTRKSKFAFFSNLIRKFGTFFQTITTTTLKTFFVVFAFIICTDKRSNSKSRRRSSTHTPRMEMDNNKAFCWAASDGDINTLRALLALPGVDPAAQDNLAFSWAAEQGNLDVLRFLLPLPGVDPAVDDNWAFRWAAYNGHLDVLRFLLPLPGVDRAVDDNFAFRWAAYNGYDDVVAFLESEQLLASGAIEYPEELVELDKHTETDAALVVYQYLSYSCVPSVERAHRQRLRSLLRQR